MNYFNKKNLAVITIIVLLIVNISAISTIVYLRYKKPDNTRSYTADKSYRMVRKEMKFSPEQMKKFRKQGAKHKEEAGSIHLELGEIRKQILDELSKPEPDTNIIFSLTEESGKLHMKLKKNTITHLIELKKSWNPEQYEMLDKMFRHALTSDDRYNPQQAQRKFKNRSPKDSMRKPRNKRR